MQDVMNSQVARALAAGFFCLSLAAPAVAKASKPAFGTLELDLSSYEYRQLLTAQKRVKDGENEPERSPALDAIIAVGARNLAWLEFINATRPEATKLQLSTAQTQRGYPIDAPTRSNESIVTAEWTALQASLPAFMTEILVGGGEFIGTLPIADDAFLAQVRLVDRVYQRAARWILQVPYLEYYTEIARRDLRGYYHLSRMKDLEGTLKSWGRLTDARKAELSGWLVSECRIEEESGCEAKLAEKVAADGHPWAFQQQYGDLAAAFWDTFFVIPATRSDVTWTAAEPEVFRIPFRDPGREDVKAWLKENIEDEWRWLDWRLTLDFQVEGDDDMTHVVFQAGATPHVNGLAGSEITMDGNRSIGEYTSRWTIRHEYGHVLGFPDCYLEFFDAAAGEMISYQLDITNMMCSRRGHLQQKHFDELKRVYLTP